MAFAENLFAEFIEKDLPRGTQNKIFFCEVRGQDNKSYRIEVYRPDNHTQVYLRKAIGFDEWGQPELFVDHDSGWVDDGIEKIFSQIEPQSIEIDGLGTEEIGSDYFESATEHNHD